MTIVNLSAFTGADTLNGSFVDGRYAQTVDHTKITANGVTMAADYTFADSGSILNNQLYRLYGDANGDRVVNGADLTPFVQQFGAPSAAFDFNGDGVVNGADLTEFIKRFGLSV